MMPHRPNTYGSVEAALRTTLGSPGVNQGATEEAKVEVSSDAVVRTHTAKEDVGGHRLYGMVEGDQLWAYDMVAMGQEVQPHLWGRLVRR